MCSFACCCLNGRRRTASQHLPVALFPRDSGGLPEREGSSGNHWNLRLLKRLRLEIKVSLPLLVEAVKTLHSPSWLQESVRAPRGWRHLHQMARPCPPVQGPWMTHGHSIEKGQS